MGSVPVNNVQYWLDVFREYFNDDSSYITKSRLSFDCQFLID